MTKRKTTTVSGAVSAPQPFERRSKSGGRDVVTMTLRLNREAWRELHNMALSEDVSINTLILSAVNEYRHRRRLAPLKPVTTVARRKMTP